ncbi:MAG: KH domain-containing protein [Campylobacterales bacterium]|nr:KH domain-containing protein [Campylobacterales bacterium]
MIEKFIEEYAKLLCSNKEAIRIEKKQIQDEYAEIIIYASGEDAGKLIGKDGKMIGSIKTFISGCKAKDGISYKVMVKAND